MARQFRYHYTVRGTGQFPFDMLRYDQAWPERESTALGVSRNDPGYREIRQVELVGLNPPTSDRWSSFGWRVIPELTRKDTI